MVRGICVKPRNSNEYCWHTTVCGSYFANKTTGLNIDKFLVAIKRIVDRKRMFQCCTFTLYNAIVFVMSIEKELYRYFLSKT